LPLSVYLFIFFFLCKELASFEDALFSKDGSAALDAATLQPGTFTIHNLGNTKTLNHNRTCSISEYLFELIFFFLSRHIWRQVRCPHSSSSSGAE
jgi:hypothetical protein